jgi:CIC family chloride channel protein
VMGLFVPRVLGVGYGYVGAVLNGAMAFKLMVLLVILKVVAVSTSYGSGNAGGIFGPSLFIGAMLGGAVGTVAHHFLPMHTATPGAYAMVGMGTVFAGVVRTPMTSILMIFETTRDYSIIVPLMISNLVSLLISSRLQRATIYEALSLQDGIHLPTPETRRDLGQRQVSRAMHSEGELLSAELTIQEAAEKIHASEYHSWPVMDRLGVIGVIGRLELEKQLGENPAKKLSEILDSLVFPHVHSDQSLDLALNRMGAAQLDVLPVVNRLNVHKLEGVITLRDILDSYGLGKH